MQHKRHCIAVGPWLVAVMLALLWVEGNGRAAQAQTPYAAYLPLLSDASADHLRWAASEPVTLAPTPSSAPLAALDRHGQLHLLWQTRYVPRFIYHTVLTDSGLSPPAPVAPTLGRSELLYPPLVDRSGTLCQWRVGIPHFWRNRIPQLRCSCGVIPPSGV